MENLDTETDSRPMGPMGVARQAANLLFGLAFVLLAAEVAVLAFAPSSTITIRNVLVPTIIAATALATMLVGYARGAGRRAPWMLVGLGMLPFAAGFVWFLFLQAVPTKFPTTADILWLSFYPLFVAAIFMLVRGQRRSERLGVSLDAAIIALATGALAYELIFDGVIGSHASDLVAGQLSYSVLDLAVLMLLALICVPGRTRVGSAYRVLAAGMTILLAGDIVLVKQFAAGTYVPGTWLDAGWPASMLVLGLASGFSSGLKPAAALRGRGLYGAIVGSFLVAAALLVEEAVQEQNPIVIVLAGLVPCLIVVRLVASVRENERLARDNEGIVRAAGEGILRNDETGRITYANPKALEMLGYPLEEVLGRRAHKLIHHTRSSGAPYPAAECPAVLTLREGATHRITDELFWRKDGSSIPVDYTASPIRQGGRIVGAVTVFDDVTHQRQMKEQLRHLADHDSLTGLYNRRRFEEELSDQIRYAKRYSRSGALLLMDLDSFKFVNDSFGHPVGDSLLCEIAAVVTAKIRDTDLAGRIGGDEFTVLLREASESEAMVVANGLIVAIREESEPTVAASIGVAVFDDAIEKTPDELLVAADVALYEAKEAGGGRAVVYTGQKGEALTWVERIRDALDADRLVVHAQPIVDLETGKVVRSELLVRMLDDHGDRIYPASFLPAAERFGLIHEIDLLVLGKAIDLAREGMAIAVNVSGLTLTDPRYLASLENALESDLDPALFNFEITETAAVANMADAQRFAQRIRELGCSLALDDFGTGFSSFTYLKHIPAQFLKIDIEFVRELQRNPADQQLVKAIVSIATGLGQKTVAEGVEDSETLNLVRELGVDYAQGFHVGHPMPTKKAADAAAQVAAADLLANPT